MDAEARGEPVAISAISLLEVVTAFESGRLKGRMQDIFDALGVTSLFEILPPAIEIAVEMAALGPSLRDPADRAIVATARVHRLTLLTSDQRIIDSRLAAVIG